MEREKNIYCDMDGVLADFNREINGVKRYKKEKGFFLKLQPLQLNVNALRRALLISDYNIYIISASPSRRADKDKIKWLKKYIPELEKDHIIMVRNGKNKVNYMKTKSGLLLDDYWKNIQDWLENDFNSGYKVEHNGDLIKVLEK